MTIDCATQIECQRIAGEITDVTVFTVAVSVAVLFLVHLWIVHYGRTV